MAIQENGSHNGEDKDPSFSRVVSAFRKETGEYKDNVLEWYKRNKEWVKPNAVITGMIGISMLAVAAYYKIDDVYSKPVREAATQARREEDRAARLALVIDLDVTSGVTPRRLGTNGYFLRLRPSATLASDQLDLVNAFANRVFDASGCELIAPVHIPGDDTKRPPIPEGWSVTFNCPPGKTLPQMN